MPTKKKPTASEPIAKTPPAKTPPAKTPPASTASAPKPKATIEVDWGKGFVVHHDAVVSENSIKVPVPLRVRQTLGQSQSKTRYDRIKVKRDGQEVRIGERRYHTKGHEDGQPSLTFEVVE